jgi:hypothetical protein
MKVDHGFTANKFPVRVERSNRGLTASCCLRSEAEKIGGGDTGSINHLAAGCGFLCDGKFSLSLFDGHHSRLLDLAKDQADRADQAQGLGDSVAPIQ